MATESAYVDTSVLGAYYCPEALSSVAEEVILRLGIPVISHLSEIEFCSLVAKKCWLNELKKRQAREIIDLFSNHVAEGFYRRMPITVEHFIKARTWIASMTSSLRTLDALHLAAATSEGLHVITADLGFAHAAKSVKARALLIK
jgi:uncharacterized protein